MHHRHTASLPHTVWTLDHHSSDVHKTQHDEANYISLTNSSSTLSTSTNTNASPYPDCPSPPFGHCAPTTGTTERRRQIRLRSNGKSLRSKGKSLRSNGKSLKSNGKSLRSNQKSQEQWQTSQERWQKSQEQWQKSQDQCRGCCVLGRPGHNALRDKLGASLQIPRGPVSSKLRRPPRLAPAMPSICKAVVTHKLCGPWL